MEFAPARTTRAPKILEQIPLRTNTGLRYKAFFFCRPNGRLTSSGRIHLNPMGGGEIRLSQVYKKLKMFCYINIFNFLYILDSLRWDALMTTCGRWMFGPFELEVDRAKLAQLKNRLGVEKAHIATSPTFTEIFGNLSRFISKNLSRITEWKESFRTPQNLMQYLFLYDRYKNFMQIVWKPYLLAFL